TGHSGSAAAFCDPVRGCPLRQCHRLVPGSGFAPSGAETDRGGRPAPPPVREQIRRGGPVTVTHPDMRRYFMTIPEAAQLVLQAGAMGEGGEIFILDMGEPVRILDLAVAVITLTGLKPFEEMDVVFTGLRPGEKLHEELELLGEEIAKTRHRKIFIGKLGAY